MTRLLQSYTGTNRRGFTLRELLVVLVVIVILAAMLFPAINAARESVRRVQCCSNLKNLGFVMHQYHDIHKTFPSAQILDADGKALHSWRTQLLPFLGQMQLYEQLRLDEPWDNERNMSLVTQNNYYLPNCPTTDKVRRKAKIDEQACKLLTNYQVVVGPQTPFERDRHTSFSDFERGTSHTYLVVETTTAVPWFSPIDLPFELLNCGVVASASGIQSMGSHHTGGAYVVFADGGENFVTNSKSPQDIALLKTMFLLAEPKNNGDHGVTTVTIKQSVGLHRSVESMNVGMRPRHRRLHS